MNRTPLYRDSLALCGVVLEEVEADGGHPALRQRLAAGALRLLDDVALALAGFDRAESLLAADGELQTLRAQLHLALELGVIEEELFLAIAEQADQVGRQIGGWLRRLQRRPAPAVL